MSGDFHEILYAIIETNQSFVQIDLWGNRIQVKVEWIFIGVFSASKLGITSNAWRKTITDRAIFNEILD